MIKVAPKTDIVRGVDVSHHNGLIDWSRIKSAGREFAFVKATEGSNIWDKRFEANRLGSKTQNMLFGAYHFFHPNVSGKVQAQHFLSAVGELDSNDLPCVLDIESTDGVTSLVEKESAKEFLQVVEDKTKKVPIIYGSPYFLRYLFLDKSFERYPLWIAHYGVKAPLVPEPWTIWTFWQVSETWAFPGLPGTNWDADVFNGPIDDLKNLCSVG